MKNRYYKIFKFISISLLAFTLTITAKEMAVGASSTKSTSLKPFIKQVYKNYGPSYTSHVEELFKVLARKNVDISVKEQSFLEFNVIKMKVVENKATAVRINNGDAVYGRDKCKISFMPRRDCYVYIFKIGTTGIITPFFPKINFSKQTNPMIPHLTYFIPPMKKWLSFEKGHGKEAIIIYASIKKNTDIERLMAYFDGPKATGQLSKQKDAKPIRNIPIISKGVGGQRKGETRKARLPFDEFGEFTATEFIWESPEIVITLWYKRK